MNGRLKTTKILLSGVAQNRRLFTRKFEYTIFQDYIEFQ